MNNCWLYGLCVLSFLAVFICLWVLCDMDNNINNYKGLTEKRWKDIGMTVGPITPVPYAPEHKLSIKRMTDRRGYK